MPPSCGGPSVPKSSEALAQKGLRPVCPQSNGGPGVLKATDTTSSLYNPEAPLL